MSNFRLSCCRLFEQHPFVKYRCATSPDRYALKILLIGSGVRMDTILQETFSNGQLLDTDLYLAILTGNAARSAKSLLSKAPELKNYAKITKEAEDMNVPADDLIYANVRFSSIKKEEEAFLNQLREAKDQGYSYVIISTGKDALNKSYAGLAASLFEEGSVISYVASKTPEEISSKAEIFAFGYEKDYSNLESLEQIAYNLHYAYSKAANNKATNEQLRKSFAEEYNYIANIEAAMHIREKLECCGIDTTDLSLAAKDFAALMEAQPAIVNRLSALEHRRWMMEKILKGYTRFPALNLIYSGEGITTHDTKNKWHACLVPCDESSQLHISNWKDVPKNRKDLDPLDKLTLLVHDRCGNIAANNREMIEESLDLIKNSALRLFKDQEEVLSAMHSMELAISQMWQSKKSALPIYEGNYETILEAVSDLKHSSSFLLKQSLLSLNDALLPLKEYISFKDYKEQDRILIRQIPFALTHKKQPILLKFLAEKETDSLFTTCQLEPDLSLFVGLVSSHGDYLKRKGQIENMNRFLKVSYPSIEKHYHVIVSDKLEKDRQEKLLALDPDHISLYEVSSMDYGTVSGILKTITHETKIDYIDVTGGNPLLMMCAGNLKLPFIAHESGSMVNILGAPEVTYPCPKKAITVKDMFDLSGSVLVKESDSSLLSDLSSRYKKLYQISANASNWDDFCKCLAEHYKDQSKLEIELPILNPVNKPASKTISLNSDIAALLIPIFEALEKSAYISDLSIKSNLSNQKSISFTIIGNTNGDIVCARIHDCVSKYTPTTSYKVSIHGKKPVIKIEDLRIDGLRFPKNTATEYSHILEDLAANNLLIDFVTDRSNKEEPSYSFQFASEDILGMIQSSGKVLEYYLYYTALLDAHFDDVEMGWHFQHSMAEDSADNELDVICTRGISSLFISAKNVSAKKVAKESNYLNYVIYEISLLSNRFGINPKTALAMPNISQFHYNNQTGEWEYSNEVKLAYSRGVYLLGRECFKGDVLGEVLDRIANGQDDWCKFIKTGK